MFALRTIVVAVIFKLSGSKPSLNFIILIWVTTELYLLLGVNIAQELEWDSIAAHGVSKLSIDFTGWIGSCQWKWQ